MPSPVSRRAVLAAGLAGAAAVVTGCARKLRPPVAAPPPAPAARVRPAARAVAEEDLPGDADWHIRHLGDQRAVEGYLDHSSVLQGEPLQLFASATTDAVQVEAFRLGWYGGARARKVWSSARLPVRLQPEGAVAYGVNTVTAGWDPTTTIPTDDWPPGLYLLRLSASDGQRYVPVVVRSPSTAGKLALVHATATWQAYNTWGGYSLYQGPGGKADYTNRARVVSFARPYDSDGAVKPLNHEQPIVALAGKLRLPVAYTTSDALHDDPTVASAASAVISLGHDEYWTPQMRANVTAARDAGVNLAFLGANACFRRIRFDEDGSVICYRTDCARDPMYGVDDAQVTNDYREPPASDPECSMTGTYYESNPVASGELTVHSPDSWLFAGTGVTQGEQLPGVMGPEYDRVNPVVTLPRPLQVLTHSPVTCRGVNSFADSAYYTTASGAGVFNAGTMDWATGVLPLHPNQRLTERTALVVTRVTANLLHAFARGPAASRFPAEDNLDPLDPWVGDPIAAHHDLWGSPSPAPQSSSASPTPGPTATSTPAATTPSAVPATPSPAPPSTSASP